MDKKNNNDFDLKNNDVTKKNDFEDSRTPFWINFGFEALFVILPLTLTWIFLGVEQRSWNGHNSLISGWILIPICVSIAIVSLIINFIFCLIKWQKVDSIMYTIGINFMMIAFIITPVWLTHDLISGFLNNLVWFVVAAVSGLIGLLIGAFINSLLRNWDYKSKNMKKND